MSKTAVFVVFPLSIDFATRETRVFFVPLIHNREASFPHFSKSSREENNQDFHISRVF